jgi:hypothetical protein
MFRIVCNCANHQLTYGPDDSSAPQYIEPVDVRIGQLNIFALGTFRSRQYQNYTCGDRYQEQCIADGSFDSYYQEICVSEPSVINPPVINSWQDSSIRHNNYGASNTSGVFSANSADSAAANHGNHQGSAHYYRYNSPFLRQDFSILSQNMPKPL